MLTPTRDHRHLLMAACFSSVHAAPKCSPTWLLPVASRPPHTSHFTAASAGGLGLFWFPPTSASRKFQTTSRTGALRCIVGVSWVNRVLAGGETDDINTDGGVEAVEDGLKMTFWPTSGSGDPDRTVSVSNTRSPGHQVTRSPGPQITRSPGHQVTMSPSYPVSRSLGPQDTRSPGPQDTTRSPGQQVPKSPGHRFIRSASPQVPRFHFCS